MKQKTSAPAVKAPSPRLGSGELPNLPEELKKHIFLKTRDQGISATLTGRVLITVIFVSDSDTDWSETEMAETKAGHKEMIRQLCAEAASFGVALELAAEYRRATVSCDLGSAPYTVWHREALQSAGFGANASVELEAERKVKEAPVLFYLNLPGRAFASAVIAPSAYTEFAVLYGSEPNYNRFRHELFHLFGARDFYYPERVRLLAEQYFPNSTMLVTEYPDIDPLTAYLIGWTDRLSLAAESFLRETLWLTDEGVAQAHKAQTYTGYVENRKMGKASYTGYLVSGLRQGLGTMVWPDGRTYTGGWVSGIIHGAGKMIYADGTRYEGEWADGRCQGMGTCVWKNGQRYEGQWKDGKRTGAGKMTFANGTVYTGEFVDGKIQGTGTCVWQNGNRYTGQWQNGKFHGQGTFLSADGRKKSGRWEENKFIG